MTRRHKKRVPRPVRVPPMIARHLTPALGISQRLAIDSFGGNWATKDQFNTLAECCNFLAHGAILKQDQEADRIADLGSAALANIKDRFLRTGRFGAAGDELQALQAMVNYSDDFWDRQGGGVFHEAYVVMNAEYGAEADQAREEQQMEAEISD